MNIIKLTGKYLDQPLLVEKFRRSVPAILTGLGSMYCLHEVSKAPERKKKKAAIRTFTTMGFTISSALAAPKIASKVFNSGEALRNYSQIVRDNSKLVDGLLKNNRFEFNIVKTLKKSRDKVLKFSEIKELYGKVGKTESGKDFLNKLIPDPENISSSEIFSKIGELSLLGFIPVAGGITGGILGDKLTEKHWKSKIPNKIKEGVYQYLANIFLCNVGAGLALGILEKLKIQSKSARVAGMVSGIITTGIIGGSAAANAIGNKLINPMISDKISENNLYSERKPEALDIGLHTDDIATVAVMSGLKWIEPALPIMYSISGYRAGIGFRNGHHGHVHNKKCKDM